MDLASIRREMGLCSWSSDPLLENYKGRWRWQAVQYGTGRLSRQQHPDLQMKYSKAAKTSTE